MPTTIDADTHIDETEDTWEYMQPGDEDFKPEAAFPKGNDEAGASLTDSYFDPLWKEANDLEMAVCMHTGSGIPNLRATRTAGDRGRSRVPFAYLPEAFSSIVMNKLPRQYPKIRWGFIEAASGWVPHELYRIERRL